jgi:hypothetical protein
MTPKQKAVELMTKFVGFCTEFHPNDTSMAKECALIAVDEVIKEYGTYYKINIDDKYVSYWQEVKQEIENL